MSTEQPTTSASSSAPEKPKPLEIDCTLTAQAIEEFDSGNYDKVLEIYDQVEENATTNASVMFSSTSGWTTNLPHNRAVVKFYKTGCKDYKTLLNELNNLESHVADKPKVETNYTAIFNKAIIYYHRHMHTTAITTLLPMIHNLPNLDDNMASLAGLLMLRLLIATNQINKALAFSEHLRVHLGLDADGKKTPEDDPEEGLDVRFIESFKLLTMLTKVLNQVEVDVPADESVEFGVLRAQQLYINEEFEESAKQLQKVAPYTDEPSTEGKNVTLLTSIANNMGVIHMRVRHFAIAAKFFQDAIGFEKHMLANMGRSSFHEMGNVRTCHILYNLGLAMLYMRKPREAFTCFLCPLKTYHSNPRLWFRISEACIMEYEMKRLQEEKDSLKQPPKGVVTKYSQSAGVPEPNLEFGALSLRNALTLANFYKSSMEFTEAEGAAASDPKDWQNVKDSNFCNPSKPLSKESFTELMYAIYAAYSYVSLRLGDFMMALEMAQNLMGMEKLPGSYRMLAHMYAGQALLLMDKFSEAETHLDPSKVSSLDGTDFETREWQINSLEAAESAVQYNLAVLMFTQNNCDMALNILDKCTHPLVAHKVASLKKQIKKKKEQR